MNLNEINIPTGITGLTASALLISGGVLVATYSLDEMPAGSGNYFKNMTGVTGLAAGNYLVNGVSTSTATPFLGSGTLRWDGTNEITSGAADANAAAIAEAVNADLFLGIISNILTTVVTVETTTKIYINRDYSEVGNYLVGFGLEWITGANAGMVSYLASVNTEAFSFTLVDAPQNAIAVGDTLRVVNAEAMGNSSSGTSSISDDDRNQIAETVYSRFANRATDASSGVVVIKRGYDTQPATVTLTAFTDQLTGLPGPGVTVPTSLNFNSSAGLWISPPLQAAGEFYTATLNLAWGDGSPDSTDEVLIHGSGSSEVGSISETQSIRTTAS